MTDAPKVYLVRAGRNGEDEDYALTHNLAIIGFQNVPSLEATKGYDEVANLVSEALPDRKPRAVGNFAGQLGAFALAMQEGDIVVLPRKLTSQIAIGRVTGPYRYQHVNTVSRHTRPLQSGAGIARLLGRLQQKSSAGIAAEPLYGASVGQQRSRGSHLSQLRTTASRNPGGVAAETGVDACSRGTRGMNVCLKPYPAMKDSGLPWLGEVPEHWDVLPLCAVATPKSTTNHQHRELLSVYLYQGVIRFSEMQEKRTNVTSEDLTKYQAVDPGDFVLNNQQAWRGSVGVSSLSGIVSPAYLVLALNGRLHTDFSNLLFRNRVMIDQYLICSRGVGSIQRNLYWPYLRRVVFPSPSLPEQSAIVRYLDHADRRIQRYIRAKQKLVTLLEEQKQALIHRAVTGKVDIRTGQPYPAYKPSGVEWLGDVPVHWEVMRSRLLFNEVNVRSTTGKETHMSMSQTVGLVPSHMVERTLTSESYVGGKLCEKGDLVLNRLKAHLGVFALAKQSGVISPDYSVFRKRSSEEMGYFEQVFLLPALRSELRIRAKGIVEGFWRLYTDDLFDIRLPVPPVSEQKEIVDVLQGTSASIDTAINRARRRIELLQQYRTRLIADVVTGKLDVREAAARLRTRSKSRSPATRPMPSPRARKSPATTSTPPVHHQYPSAPEIKDLRTVHASANERISRLRSRS